MAVSLVHTTTATGTNNDDRQISVTAWNEAHTLTGTAGTAIVFGEDGAAGERALGVAAATDIITRADGDGRYTLASTVSVFGASLIDDADAAAARTTLGLGSAALKNTGTSGATVPLLNAANTWSAVQTFSAGQNTGSGVLVGSANINLLTAAGNQRQVIYKSGNVARIAMITNNAAEAGNGNGSQFLLAAYNDDGSFAGNLLTADRASLQGTGTAYTGKGNPHFSSHAATHFNMNRATSANGTVGNQITVTDEQPTYTLLTDPIATTNGSASVVVTWAGHPCEVVSDVKFPSAPVVGGITFSGYYRVTAVTADTITIKADTPATSTATGGTGATIKPYFPTVADRMTFTIKASSGYFPVGRTTFVVAEPDYYRTAASGDRGPQYEGHYTYVMSPSDDTQLNYWSVASHEYNVNNRGADEGYSRDLTGAVRYCIGVLSVPEGTNASFGGNEGKNCTAAFVVSRSGKGNSTNYFMKWYQGYCISPNSLVSNESAVGGVGGIGVDINGAYNRIISNGIATTLDSAVVTVTLAPALLITGHNTPNSVWFPAPVTVRGVTIPAGIHPITVTGESTFQVTGSTVATSSGAGGGSDLWLAFDKSAPRAPFQASGWFSQGIQLTDLLLTDNRAVRMRNGHAVAARNAADTADIDLIKLNANDLLELGAAVKHQTTTVASLPAAATAGAGVRSFVTDATATTFATVVAGGGANKVPVYCTGEDWRIG